MSEVLRLVSFDSYSEFKSKILNLEIERKVIYVYVLKKNGVLTLSMQHCLDNSYYKITSINKEIVKISPKKYEELIAHVLMNVLCNKYLPNMSDVRLLNGMIIYAFGNKRSTLFLLLTLILWNSDSLLKFYDFKNSVRFSNEMQRTLEMLNKKSPNFFRENFVQYPIDVKEEILRTSKDDEEKEIQQQEKIIEMKEAIIELDELLIELQEAEIEEQERLIELQEMEIEAECD